MIRKVSGKYIVFSESGKKLSKPYSTKSAAENRLEQIHYFKNKKG